MQNQEIFLYRFIGHDGARRSDDRWSVIGKDGVHAWVVGLEFDHYPGDDFRVSPLPVAGLDSRETLGEGLRDLNQVLHIPDRVDDHASFLFGLFV